MMILFAGSSGGVLFGLVHLNTLTHDSLYPQPLQIQLSSLYLPWQKGVVVFIMFIFVLVCDYFRILTRCLPTGQ
jgi:hypothetical protein